MLDAAFLEAPKIGTKNLNVSLITPRDMTGLGRKKKKKTYCQLFAFGACTDIGFRADPYPVVRSEIGLDVDGRRFERELDPLDFERARVTECERGCDDGARLPGVQSRDEARDQ